jgi:hypothetical protein
VPSTDECSLHPFHAPLAQRDPGPRRGLPGPQRHRCGQGPGALSPRCAGRRRRPKATAPAMRRLDPVPEGVGHTPLVDFCNQHHPRAPPLDRLNPGPRVRRLPSSARLSAAAGSKPHRFQGPLARTPGSRQRSRVYLDDATGWRRASARTSLAARSRFRAAPAEVSRARGRPAFAARRLSQRFLAARASPQPDRLGHLSS